MDVQTAQVILYTITGVAVVVWLTGLRFLIASFRTRKERVVEQFGAADAAPENVVAGKAEVEGRPADLAAKAASLLAKEGIGPFGQLKILEVTDDRVRFEGSGRTRARRSVEHSTYQGQLTFTPAAHGRTCIEYRIGLSPGRGLFIGGAIFQTLGLIALAVGFWLIHTLVVPNPNPAIRGQTFQMLQVVHFLWPPFLFGGLYRTARRTVRTRFDTLIHNLPHIAP